MVGEKGERNSPRRKDISFILTFLLCFINVQFSLTKLRDILTQSQLNTDLAQAVVSPEYFLHSLPRHLSGFPFGSMEKNKSKQSLVILSN